jgi:hypothetical protein
MARENNPIKTMACMAFRSAPTPAADYFPIHLEAFP